MSVEGVIDAGKSAFQGCSSGGAVKEGQQSLITRASVDVADEGLIEVAVEISTRGSRSYRVDGVILQVLKRSRSRVAVVVVVVGKWWS